MSCRNPVVPPTPLVTPCVRVFRPCVCRVSWMVDGGTLSVTTAVLVAVAQGIPLVYAVWWAIDSVTDVGWIMGVCA